MPTWSSEASGTVKISLIAVLFLQPGIATASLLIGDLDLEGGLGNRDANFNDGGLQF